MLSVWTLNIHWLFKENLASKFTEYIPHCFEKVWFAWKLKQVFSQKWLRLELNAPGRTPMFLSIFNSSPIYFNKQTYSNPILCIIFSLTFCMQYQTVIIPTKPVQHGTSILGHLQPEFCGCYTVGKELFINWTMPQDNWYFCTAIWTHLAYALWLYMDW